MAAKQVPDFTPPSEGELVAVTVEGDVVAVAVLAGELHAFDAKCPHAACSLVNGDLDERAVTCPCHFARFDITTGAVLAGPARSGVRIWSVSLQDGTLQLDGPRDPAPPADAAQSSAAVGPADAGPDQDITVVIEREHEALRRQFRDLKRDSGAGEVEQAWRALVQLLEIHASGEEVLLYPHLVKAVEEGAEESHDAVHDHNRIRDSLRAVERHPVGTDSWWAAIELARRVNEDHLREEESTILPSFRRNVPRHRREELGQQWVLFHEEHQEARGLSGEDTEPRAVIDQPSA
ncbi:MAG: Rieske 2Fe-2S domain-containing protein [Actinomycetota bacterium]|nr:Rieske 2Fe-2S domain-containing protein [Actinomycetota bacterium]